MSTAMIDESNVHTAEQPHRHRISVQDYHRMVEVGLLGADAHIELIDGAIFDLAPTGEAHRATVRRLEQRLRRAIAAQGIVVRNTPIRLGADSEPQPDLAVLRARPDGYRTAAPGAADTLLVIEVSDSTWHYDHDTKVPSYARHGIPEVWLFDLTSATVHFFRGLTGAHYADEAATENPGLTFLPELTDVAVDLAEVLPRA
ncbi:MAG: Uma2 family endonuclease [Steroidobacteraceae bacterium]